MRTTRLMMIAALVVGAQAGVVAADETRPTSDAKNVFMWFGGSLLPGLWLTGHDGGWSVPLPYVADDACTAQMHDISPSPLPRADRAEPLAPKTASLTLPRPRYTGSHTYRISFRCERSRVADLLVHLEPSAQELAAWLDAEPLPPARKLASR